MLKDAVIWLYIINVTLLMMHETEAAYWKEWTYFGKWGKSFSDKAGLSVFVLARIPICIPLLYGLIRLPEHTGLVFSLIFCSFIILFHFPAHMYFLKKGRGEFRWPVSYLVQICAFAVSAAQLAVTIVLMKSV